MQKDDFVDEIARRTNVRKNDIAEIVNVIIDIFHDVIRQRVEFNVRGFGQLKYITTAAHEGSKPTPGVKGKSEKIMIPERESVKFLLASDLRNLVKDGDNEE